MLSWWTGRPADEERVEDGLDQEQPETPAPIFAARALKSAIFGTPAPPNEDTVYEIERETDIMVERNNTAVQPRGLSPTKPAGILLTPGTATTRRKTVSFDNLVVDKQEILVGAVAGTRSGIPDDCPGKFPSPWVPRTDSSTKSTRKTALTKTLEDAREGKTNKVETSRTTSTQRSLDLNIRSTPIDDSNSKSSRRRTSKLEQSSQDQMRQPLNDPEGDMTMDLNQPLSQSGRYWKSEYEQYHQQAQAEMTKLINYKRLAKSYAKLKDAENVNLSEKLKEFQQKVVDMETKISQLSAQIAACGLDGKDDDSPELIKELARQTALAVQYKIRVREFETAMQVGDSHTRRNSQDTEDQVLQEAAEGADGSKRSREHRKEMRALTLEFCTLRQSMLKVERANVKLQEEKEKLAQDLLHADLRLETHLEKCKKKRRSLDEHREKKDDALKTLQNDYDKIKEAAKSQRRDAEQLLKKRHDQAVEMRKELASMRGADSTVQELRQVMMQKDSQHSKIVAELRKEIEDLKGDRRSPSHNVVSSMTDKDRQKVAAITTLETTALVDLYSQESQIPVPVPKTISRPSKAVQPPQKVHSQTPTSPAPRHRSSHPALREIVNNAGGQPTPFQRSGPVQHTPVPKITPLASRISNMSLDSPDLQLESPEPSLPHVPSRAVHDRNCNPSLRLAMFNIVSSPPKAAITRPQVSSELSRQRSTTYLESRQPANFASGRISSLMEGSRVRGDMPTDRAEAAKARLQQKQAEKKRARALGGDKENTPNPA